MKRTYLPFRLLFSLWVLMAFHCAAQNAPLKKGDWAKVGWVNDGIYALRGSDLTALGLGSGPWASASIGVYHNKIGCVCNGFKITINRLLCGIRGVAVKIKDNWNGR
jgi:hypothetical protein